MILMMLFFTIVYHIFSFKYLYFPSKVEEVPVNAPIKEEVKKEDIYESIHKYTFYEYDDDWVR